MLNSQRDNRPVTADSEDDRPSRLRFLLTFGILALLFALGQIHRSSGGVMASIFADSFDLAPSAVGLVIGIMFMAQGAGQLPAGVLLDRFGVRWVVPAACMLGGVGCFVIAASPSWPWLVVGRLLLGFGFAPALMGSVALFSRYASPQQLSTLTGRYLFIGMAGGIFGTGPLTLLIELYGWRPVFAAIGAVTIATAIFAPVIIGKAIGGPVQSPDTSKSLAQTVTGLAVVFRSRKVWPILFVAPFIYTPNQLLLGLWAGPYLSDVHGFDPVSRGYALTAMMIAMSLGVLVFGPLERLVGAKRPVVICGASSVALSFAGLSTLGQHSAVLAVVFCATAIFSSCYFVLTIAHAQGFFPPAYSGRSVAAIGLLGISGVFATQLSTALLLSLFPGPPGTTATGFGYSVMFALVAAIFVAIAAIYRTTEE